MAKPRNTTHRVGRRYRHAKAVMHAMFGDTCHICGHAGAGEADHLIPISLVPDQPLDPEAMRPAHGSNYPCVDPTCMARKGKPRSCNQERGNIINRKRTATYTPRMTW
jgi:hypothetical protein